MASLLKAIGVMDRDTHVFTEANVLQMMGLLIKPNPVDVSTLAVKHRVDGNSTFRRGDLLEVAQSLVNMLPPSVTDYLKASPFSMSFDSTLPLGVFGDYHRESRTIRLHPLVTKLSMLRPQMYHELMHWVFYCGPPSYRNTIKELLRKRTGGFQDQVVRLHMAPKKRYPEHVTGMPDDLAGPNGDEYAARIYPEEDPKNPEGSEIPTIHLEKLALHPSALLKYLNYQSTKSGRYAWREAFFESLTIFFTHEQDV